MMTAALTPPAPLRRVLGIAASVLLLVAAGSATGTVVEFNNAILDHYFITADAAEAAAIDNGSAGPGWSRTGYKFNSGGTTAVCRFYGSLSPGPNSHFYAPEGAECTQLRNLQQIIPASQPRWNFESLDFLTTPATTTGVNGSCPAGTVPVYRAYNNGFARGADSNHRITTRAAAIQEVVARGWIDEGIAMCGAAAANWENVPLPVNMIESVSVSPVDRRIVYAGQRNSNTLLGAENAVWRSDDGGSTFRVVARGVSFQLFPSPTDPDRVFGTASEPDVYAGYGINQALYVSRNRGVDWQRAFGAGQGVLLHDYGTALALGQHPSQKDIVYAYGRPPGSVGEAVFKSADGGATWVDVTPQGAVFRDYTGAFAFDPLHPDTVFLSTHYTAANGTDGVLLRSVDGARSWQAADTGLIVTNADGSTAHHLSELVVTSVPGVLVGVSDFGHMWINSDGGAGTWRALPLPGGSVDQFVWSSQLPNTLVTLNRDGTMLRSDNLGSTWEAVVTPGKILGSTLDASNSLGIFITTVNDEALYRSADAGRTWTQLPRPPFSISYYPGDGSSGERVAVTAVDRDRVVALHAGYGSLPLFSVLADQQWKSPGGLEAFRSTVAVSSLAAFGNRLAAAGQGALFEQDLQGRWTRVPLPDGFWSEGARLSSDGDRRGFYGGLYLLVHGFHGTLLQDTTDGGAQWTSGQRYEGFAGEAVFDTPGGRFWYISASSLLVTWQVVPVRPDGSSATPGTGLPAGGLNALANSPKAPSTLYVGTAQGIYRSTDAGATWKPAGSPLSTVSGIAVDPNDSSAVWAFGEGGLAHSTDGGDHWAAVAPGNFASGVAGFALHPARSGVMAAAAASGVLVSVDGGATWRNVGGPTAHVRQMRIVDDAINVATDGGLLACSDLCLPN